VLRRYQRNLVGGAGLAGWLGLFFVPGDDFREGSEGAFYFFLFFSLFCAKGMAAAGEPARAVIALVPFRRITTTVLLLECQDFHCY